MILDLSFLDEKKYQGLIESPFQLNPLKERYLQYFVSFRFSEISVHPHVQQLISNPGGLHLNQSVHQSQGGDYTQHPHPPPEN